MSAIAARLAKLERESVGPGCGYIVHVNESEEATRGKTPEQVREAQNAEANAQLRAAGYKLGPRDLLVMIRRISGEPAESVGRFKLQ